MQINSGNQRKAWAINFLMAFFILYGKVCAQDDTVVNAQKIASQILKENLESYEQKSVRAIINDKQQFYEWCQENETTPELLNDLQKGNSIFLINLDDKKIKMLSKKSWVIYLDRAGTNVVLEGVLLNYDPTLNEVTKATTSQPSNKGENITIAIKEDPFNIYDLDLFGRTISEIDRPENGFSTHSTEMATIIAGAGYTSPSFKGVVSGASLFSSPLNDLLPDDSDLLADYHVSVQNHSYGVGNIENYYGAESLAYDDQASYTPYLVHVFSAGNLGDGQPQTGPYIGMTGYGTLTGQIKNSKNSICVGATDHFGSLWDISSSGPTADGRIKPEVVAYGANGTSDATALVSGVCGLLQEQFFGENGILPNSSLIKALIINEAKNKKELSHREGFGNVKAYRSLETLVNGQYFEGNVGIGGGAIHSIVVPEGVKKLNVTIVWNDLPSETLGMGRGLVNNLDMRLVKDGGEAWNPWKLSSYPDVDSLALAPVRSRDTLNNVEKITVDFPTEGTYELEITAGAGNKGPQPYSIAYSYRTSNEWVYPSKEASLISGTEQIIRWESDNGSDAMGRLELAKKSKGAFGEWQVISDDINTSEGFYQWNIPTETAICKLRLVIGQDIIESPEFSITELYEHRVEYSCEGISTISWEPIEQAEKYNVYVFENGGLELAGETKGTVFSFERDNSAQFYTAVAPVFQGRELKRTPATPMGLEMECFIQNFYLERSFSDEAIMNLSLRSVVDVSVVVFEKWDGSQFKELYRTEPNNQLSIGYTDKIPGKGTIEYRARVITDQGNQYVSDIQEFFGLGSEEILAAPVPARQGEIVELFAAGEGQYEVYVHGLDGSLKKRSLQDTAVKTIDTSLLPAGVYIVNMIGEGRNYRKKIIVN